MMPSKNFNDFDRLLEYVQFIIFLYGTGKIYFMKNKGLISWDNIEKNKRISEGLNFAIY